jgi:hypothetical protein
MISIKQYFYWIAAGEKSSPCRNPVDQNFRQASLKLKGN